MSQWKVIPEGSVEGQASRGDARYLLLGPSKQAKK